MQYFNFPYDFDYRNNIDRIDIIEFRYQPMRELLGDFWRAKSVFCGK